MRTDKGRDVALTDSQFNRLRVIGRDQAEARTVLHQSVSMGTTMGVSGGRVEFIENGHGEVLGLVLPSGRGYAVEVTLNAADLFDVTRSRLGRSKGTERNLYVDMLDDAVYRASCWANVNFGGEPAEWDEDAQPGSFRHASHDPEFDREEAESLLVEFLTHERSEAERQGR